MKNEELVTVFKPLIVSIAKKFHGVELDDLINAGTIGLLNAKKHFHEDNNTKFSTFAYQYIFGEMYALSLSNHPFKTNRETLKLCKLIDKTYAYLAQTINHNPTINDLATYLELPATLITSTIATTKDLLSLDQEQDNDTNLYNTIGKLDINLDNHLDLNESLSNLTIPEQQIIHYRYFEDLTQQETAKKLELSQVTVSRYETKSLKKLSQYLGA